MSEFFKNNKRKLILIPVVLLAALILYIIVDQTMFFAKSYEVDNFVRTYFSKVEELNKNYIKESTDTHRKNVNTILSYFDNNEAMNGDEKYLLALQNENKVGGGEINSFKITELRFGALRKNPFKSDIDVTVFFKANLDYKTYAKVYNGTGYAEFREDSDSPHQEANVKVVMKIKKINGAYKITQIKNTYISDQKLD